MKNELIIYDYGSEFYLDSDGNKYWYQNSKRHREDGAAIENINGNKYWYYKGEFIDCETNEEFLRIVKLILFW